jgi:multiple sugar transport system substrate-binding protein
LIDLVKEHHNPPDHYGIALKAHPSEILFDWLPFFYAAGGVLADEDLKPAFSSKAGVEALEMYCQLREYAPSETHTFGNEEIAEIIIQGQAALITTWGGQAAPIFLNQANSFLEKYGAAIFPHPCGGTWGITLPANQSREDQLKALQSVLKLNDSAMDLDVLLAAGSPIRETSYTAEAFEKYSWLRAQREIYNRLTFLPFDPRISLYLGPLTEALYSAFLGDKSAPEALNDAESTILSTLT